MIVPESNSHGMHGLTLIENHFYFAVAKQSVGFPVFF